MVTSDKKTVLITGAGGAAVPGLIRRLRKNGYIVVAADMDPLAAGFYYANKSFVIPAGNSMDFLPAISDICSTEKVDVIVPLVDEELLACLELERDAIAVMLPRYDFVETCLDKYALMGRLSKANIAIPETRLATNGHEGLMFPLVVKPRIGRGSRGLQIVRTEAELSDYFTTTNYAAEALILQEYIEGVEYTVSAVAWRDGEVQAVVPKEIISKKGITKLAVTRRNSRIDELCYRVQSQLRPDGPFNVQLRIDERSGEPLIFEINPRFSTTISLTIAAGIDELGGLLSQAIYGRGSYEFGEWQEDIVLLRQTLDEFISEADFLACYAEDGSVIKTTKGVQQI